MTSQIDVGEFEKLYYDSVSPSDIAKAMNVRYSVLGTWMYNHHYAAICPAQQKIALEMHQAGATDLDIAEKINRQVSTVTMWRLHHSLKKNKSAHNGGRPRKAVIQ